MVRAVAEEALALASITLFLAMVAVWAQVLAVVWTAAGFEYPNASFCARRGAARACAMDSGARDL